MANECVSTGAGVWNLATNGGPNALDDASCLNGSDGISTALAPEFKRYINCKIFLINVRKWQFDWSFKCHSWSELNAMAEHIRMASKHVAVPLLVYCFCGFPFHLSILAAFAYAQNAYLIFGKWKPVRTAGACNRFEILSVTYR